MALTDDNKRLVTAFVDTVLIGGAMNRIAEFINPAQYIQHNTDIADGLDGLGAAFKTMAEQGVHMRFTKRHMVLGQGNFVLVTSEGTFAGKPTAFYDLFRVERGSIVEHWDVIATIPPRSTWKNANGKF